MSDCHICGRMIVPPGQSVRFPSCECHIDMAIMRDMICEALSCIRFNVSLAKGKPSDDIRTLIQRMDQMLARQADPHS